MTGQIQSQEISLIENIFCEHKQGVYVDIFYNPDTQGLKVSPSDTAGIDGSIDLLNILINTISKKEPVDITELPDGWEWGDGFNVSVAAYYHPDLKRLSIHYVNITRQGSLDLLKLAVAHLEKEREGQLCQA